MEEITEVISCWADRGVVPQIMEEVVMVRRCSAGYGGGEGIFGAFFVIFRALPVVPELSASRSWGALDDEEFFVIEGSGWR